MNKLFIILLILCLAITVNAQTIPKWKSTDLEAAIKNAEKPTIINFWATFCKPCLEELPYFQEAVKRYDSLGVQLILVSLDLPEVYNTRLLKFTQKLKITVPVKWLDETNADLFCPIADPKWSGAIPASLFINNSTGYRSFFEDQLSKEQLETELKKLTASK
jgi:thiol-disulfide isomerase/thioredoxin